MITGNAVRVERVQRPSLDFLATLIDDSERQGLRFVRRLADEWAGGVNRFDRPGEALFAAWIEAQLYERHGFARVDLGDCTHAIALGRAAA